MMNVLVLCECSGVFLSEFLKYPCFNAYSCDLKPNENPLLISRHIQCDALAALYSPHHCFTVSGDEVDVDVWDFVVAFPPCTYFTNAGSRWFYSDKRDFYLAARSDSVDFVNKIYSYECPYMVIENPRGYMSHILGKCHQEVHPWYFGDNVRKRTCFWYRGLPLLTYDLSDKVDPGLFYETYVGSDGYLKRKSFVLSNVDSTVRSRSFPSLAACAVSQWFEYFNSINNYL